MRRQLSFCSFCRLNGCSRMSSSMKMLNIEPGPILTDQGRLIMSTAHEYHVPPSPRCCLDYIVFGLVLSHVWTARAQ